MNSEKVTAYEINFYLFHSLNSSTKYDTLPNKLQVAVKKLDLHFTNPQNSFNINNLRNQSITSISLNVTQTCNLNCIYCYGGDGSYGNKSTMTLVTATKSIDWLFENSGKGKKIGVVFFGGEPLLNFPLIKKVVKYSLNKAEVSNKKINFSVTTNGTQFTDQVIKYLNKHNFTVLVSFDGDEKIQNLNRPFKNGKGSYSNIVKGTKRFLQSRGGRVTARATVTKNFPNISKIRKDLCDFGFDRVEFATVSAKENTPFALDKQDYKNVEIDAKEQAKFILEQIKKHVNALQGASNILKYINILRTRSKKQFTCGAGRGLNAIDTDGVVYPCHRFVGMEEYKYDNINEFNKKSRIKFLQKIAKKDKLCQNCWVKYFCGGGCYHDNLVVTGNLTKPNKMFCYRLKKEVEMAIYIYSQLNTQDLKYLKHNLKTIEK